MNCNIEYNNHILTDTERRNLLWIADETLKTFAEAIDGTQQIMEEFSPSQSSKMNLITETLHNISIFICYSYGDCILLTKYFLSTLIPYEKSFFRGKLKVQLNESFKKLYGFTEQAHKTSYCAKLGNIMDMFPGFKSEFNQIISDLDEISKQDNWWKDIRNAEVHIDIPTLYESRHEEINESKVAMETMRLIDFFKRFNDLICRMNQAAIDYMWKKLQNEQRLI